MPTGYVYIITNAYNNVLYTGVTSDLKGRIMKHRQRTYCYAFSSKYNLYKLVYYEKIDRITDAISREKQLKAGPRKVKLKLIETINPEWRDLFDLL